MHFDVSELSGLQQRFRKMKKKGLGIDREGLARLLSRSAPLLSLSHSRSWRSVRMSPCDWPERQRRVEERARRSVPRSWTAFSNYSTTTATGA